jgi:hypothetical protein
MIRLQLILIALVAGASAIIGRGAERPQHNFLFIVDSSSAMERHKPMAIKLVQEVIASKFEEQIEPGDSIDIWTYDADKNLHGFPPQIWKPAEAQSISEKARDYLEQYPFHGKSDFSRVAADLNLLVPQTKALLIVVITAGETPFSGIHLDLDINEFLGRKGKLGPGVEPFLISMAAIKGALRTWTAHFGKGEADLATLPIRPGSIAKSAKRDGGGVKEQSRTNAVAKQTPQTGPVRQSSALRASSLTLVPSSEFTFNFPPGTKITPMPTPAAPVKRAERSLAELAAERLRAQSPSTARIPQVNTVPATEKPSSNQRSQQNTNAAVAARVGTPTNGVMNFPSNVSAAKSGGTNENPTENKAPTGSIAGNNIATAALTPSMQTASAPAVKHGAASNTQVTLEKAPTTVVSSGVVEKKASVTAGRGAGLNSDQTLRRAIYASILTGVGGVFLLGYLLYRRIRRPSESIISRSLLQR